MAEPERWQLEGDEPWRYERYKVPKLFGPLAERFIEHVGFKAGERVLDVACGTGIVARLVAQRVGSSGKVAGVDLNAGMLAVARATTPQTGLSAAARIANLHGAFRVRPRRERRVRGLRVLLVDDVVTTGATVAAATRALLGAGAVAVVGFAVARAES